MNLGKINCLSLKDLFSLKLEIPEYQRPYKWQSKHVHQLIDDIIYVSGDQYKYSLGTAVLFNHQQNPKPENPFEIVDGQQRLTTLTILLNTFSEGKINLPLLNSNYENEISRYNIIEAKKVVSSRKSELTEDVINFLIGKCYFNVFILNKKKEAFQFFDTQNSRGLDLKPHDLLKAFHLRAMPNESENKKKSSVEKWEGYNKNDLHSFIYNHLYRIRKWSKTVSGLDYSKETIDIFKGIDLDKNSKINRTRKAKMVEFALKHGDSVPNTEEENLFYFYPMEYNQIIPNGQRFFEMIDFYKNNPLYNNLKDYDRINNSLKFFKEEIGYDDDNLEILIIINRLDSRKGDLAIRNMFFNALCLFYDKFGDEKASIVFNKLFVYCYKLRFESKKVGFDTVDGKALAFIFRFIEDALSVRDLINLRIDTLLATQRIDNEDYVKDLENIILKFKDLL